MTWRARISRSRPDSRSSARTPVTLFLATAPKLAALALIVRILVHSLGSLHETWSTMIMFVAVLLLIGVVLRVGIRVFQWLYIPASVIAGTLGLIFLQSLSSDVAVAVEPMVLTLRSWPGWLIAVVFGGKSSRSRDAHMRTLLDRGFNLPACCSRNRIVVLISQPVQHHRGREYRGDWIRHILASQLRSCAMGWLEQRATLSNFRGGSHS